MSRELPIIFNTEMVKAILDGRKVCTRRPLRNIPCDYEWSGWVIESTDRKQEGKAGFKPKGSDEYVYTGGKYERPPYQTGDLLYVRETWNDDWCDKVLYKADGGSAIDAGYKSECKWKPSIHMPKKYARLWLKVTGVRVEKLLEIDHFESAKEGFINDPLVSAKDKFLATWNSIYKNVKDNPWVWVIDFEVVNHE